MLKQFHNGLPDGRYYHLVTHGGIGDISWVYSKLCHLELPLFIEVCNEAPYRPKRVGDYLDTLPKVCGWRYADKSFGKSGGMWCGIDDPAAAFHKKWADLNVKPNEPTRIEANKWLESGYKLSDWLPDLPTDYHYKFDDSHIPPIELKQPAVGLHFTGWPDIQDGLWVEATRILNRRAYVYLLSAPYDTRTKTLLPQLQKAGKNVIPVVGQSWATAWATMKELKYILGHASGLTILANVLGIPGAVVNPLIHTKLRDTWNDPNFVRQVQIQTCEQFMAAAFKIAESIPSDSRPGGKEELVEAETLGKTLLDALMQKDVQLSHSSTGVDYIRALGIFRHPRRLLYIGSNPDNLVTFLSGIYTKRENRVEVVQIIDPAPRANLVQAVKERVQSIPFKPAVRIYTGSPATDEARKMVCQAAPFDLSLLDISEHIKQEDLVYNSLSMASYVTRSGGGLTVLNDLNTSKELSDQYFDFCASRDRKPAIARGPAVWGLLFQ